MCTRTDTWTLDLNTRADTWAQGTLDPNKHAHSPSQQTRRHSISTNTPSQGRLDLTRHTDTWSQQTLEFNKDSDSGDDSSSNTVLLCLLKIIICITWELYDLRQTLRGIFPKMAVDMYICLCICLYIYIYTHLHMKSLMNLCPSAGQRSSWNEVEGGEQNEGEKKECIPCAERTIHVMVEKWQWAMITLHDRFTKTSMSRKRKSRCCWQHQGRRAERTDVVYDWQVSSGNIWWAQRLAD